MSDADLTLESLAEYLHLNLSQVQKLVERRELPGRRVGGEWRFSREEINRWLESRIGLEADQELARMESALHRSHSTPDTWTVADLLTPAAIEIPLAARTRNSAIDGMTDVAARTGWLWDPARMADAVRNREDMHPTALENGMALLHPRRPLGDALEQPFLAFGRTERGIPFGGSRGVLTDMFFLICSLNDTQHLHSLARLSRLVAAQGFVPALREAADAGQVLDAVKEFESQL